MMSRTRRGRRFFGSVRADLFVPYEFVMRLPRSGEQLPCPKVFRAQSAYRRNPLLDRRCDQAQHDKKEHQSKRHINDWMVKHGRHVSLGFYQLLHLWLFADTVTAETKDRRVPQSPTRTPGRSSSVPFHVFLPKHSSRHARAARHQEQSHRSWISIRNRSNQKFLSYH